MRLINGQVRSKLDVLHTVGRKLTLMFLISQITQQPDIVQLRLHRRFEFGRSCCPESLLPATIDQWIAIRGCRLQDEKIVLMTGTIRSKKKISVTLDTETSFAAPPNGTCLRTVEVNAATQIPGHHPESFPEPTLLSIRRGLRSAIVVQ
jgi:hypothetical protein